MNARSCLVLALLMPTLAGQVPPVGAPHPDFLLPDLDGRLGRLSEYRGKKILLFHFASW